MPTDHTGGQSGHSNNAVSNPKRWKEREIPQAPFENRSILWVFESGGNSLNLNLNAACHKFVIIQAFLLILQMLYIKVILSLG